MRFIRKKLLAALVLGVAVVSLVSCRGGDGDGPPPPEILVLSNRADLVSGGDALVEIKWPSGANTSEVKVELNGTDVKAVFELRANGRYMGLLGSLREGVNTLTARAGSTAAKITITNHSLGGPIFSGAQLLPVVCATMVPKPVTVTVPSTGLSATATSRASGLASDPIDDQCNATAQFSYYYQPIALQDSDCTFTVTGVNPCFVPFPSINDPSSRPVNSAIADFTNDRGQTAKSIVRLERGAMNRGIYQLVTFYDPATASGPWSPQSGWNGKLVYRPGGGGSLSRFQSSPATAVFDDKSLRRGFMTAAASLTEGSTNTNDTLAAETILMLKERITEIYGPIRYTIGDGCSHGTIVQQSVTSGYPGIFDGLITECNFPDSQAAYSEVYDCGLLQANYYTTATGTALTPEQMAAINGHATTGVCSAWQNSFLSIFTPSRAANCGNGFPAAITYDSTLRPNGVRCANNDHLSPVVGRFADGDGVLKGNSPFDNVGVQYGLKALRDGVINSEEFVLLNMGVGQYNADFIWSPEGRNKADAAVLHTMYSGGSLMTDGRQLAKVAIIDMRRNSAPTDIHTNKHSWETRDRLDRDAGGHANQVIWAFNGTGSPGAALYLKAFVTMDNWLKSIESDTSGGAVQEKVIRNKPGGLGDVCLTTVGAADVDLAADVGLDTPACPVTHQGSPRTAAGAPLADNILKCQLKAIDFSSADYGGKTFTPDQQLRLTQVFSGGVCDWTRAGVAQVPIVPWTTYQAGPGGRPLESVPVSQRID